MAIPPSFGRLISNAFIAAPPAPVPRQPFWGLNGAYTAGFIPGEAQGNDPKSSTYDPNWEAPTLAWSEWDTATIGTKKVPGIVRVKARRGHRIDKKQTPGGGGATPTYLGVDPAEVDLSCQMWTKSHLSQYEDLVAMMLDKYQEISRWPPTPRNSGVDKKQAWAFEVIHPALVIARVTDLYLLSMGIPEPTPQTGVFMATFRFQEFRPIPQNESVRQGKATVPISTPVAVDPTGATPTKDPTQLPKASQP